MSVGAIDSLLQESRIFEPSHSFKSDSNAYAALFYADASRDRLQFWADRASELNWFKPWTTILDWQRPYASWFKDGTLNAAYNCLDVHLNSPIQDKVAIVWEGECGTVLSLTYGQLHEKVCQLAQSLQTQFQVRKGDRVTIYMPMISELLISVLACARIGAIHSVVFGGFSAKSLKDRLIDSGSRVLITADGGYRRGAVLALKDIVDEALLDGDTAVTSVIVKRRLGEDVCPIHIQDGRDFDYDSCVLKCPSTHDSVEMDSEDPLFILYTSGTTGKPKGIIHTTGGYLTHAKYSTKAVFELQDSDVYFCTADIGWITGHTYVVYGPLSNGATVVLYEGAPDYPDKDRFWALISKHKVTIFYTAPTAIRAFMKWGVLYPQRHNLSSLRLLGSVGEPINPEAWAWYYETIGCGRCPIVDTWWQTETGGIMITTLPSFHVMKPGSAGLPLPGISAAVLTESGDAVQSGGGLLSLTEPWPSMLRGIWGDPERYEEVYWSRFNTYFAGDGAVKDTDGYYRVLGRVDDVLNCAGHRIGTMEVESALVEFQGVAEAAVVGIPDEIKGQAILAFVTLKEGVSPSNDLSEALKTFVSAQIGAIARPKLIVFSPDLPKTRSGKIMRRILKALAEKQDVGDTMTLANPDVVPILKQRLEQ